MSKSAPPAPFRWIVEQRPVARITLLEPNIRLNPRGSCSKVLSPLQCKHRADNCKDNGSCDADDDNGDNWGGVAADLVHGDEVFNTSR